MKNKQISSYLGKKAILIPLSMIFFLSILLVPQIAGAMIYYNNLTVSCYANPSSADTNQPVNFISNVSGGTGNYTYIWSGACSTSVYSSNCIALFSQAGNYTANLSVNSGGYTATANCNVNVNQKCISHASAKCAGNDIYWYDSCGNVQDLYQSCQGQTCSGNSCVVIQPVYTKNYKKACYKGSIYWYDSNNSVQDLFKDCQDNNQCTVDGCANNKCENTLKCDGSACSMGSDDYCNSCNHIGDGSCNCQETNAAAPQDCKANINENNNTPADSGNIDVSLLCKNLALSSDWSKDVTMSENQEISCMITVKNSTILKADNVLVSVQLPNDVAYADNLQLNGVPIEGDIISGYNLGLIESGKSETVIFNAKTQSIAVQGMKQVTASASFGNLLDSDVLSLNFVPSAIESAAVSGAPVWFSEFLKRWFAWIFVGAILVFLFIVVFRRLSSEK